MKPTITLCMIVKNETAVIERCLRSMGPNVDRYDITDTGSTDGTPEKIKEIMDELGIPGEVYLSDWKGFGDHAGKMGSRTESLQNCKGKADYAWIIDADDSYEGEHAKIENTDSNSYALRINRGEFTWWRNQIFKVESNWKYKGILHEYAECENCAPTSTRLEGNYAIIARTEGNERNVGKTAIEKYAADAEILEKACQDEPDNQRYQFYLGQSYFDCQNWEKAKENYEKRFEMGGWPEEAWYSLYRIAMIEAIMDKPVEVVIHAFMRCYNHRPTRSEPLFQAARIYRLNNLPASAYIYAKQGLEIPYPDGDILFIQDEVYKFALLDEVGATAFYAGKPNVGYAACSKLLEDKLYPSDQWERIQTNFDSYKKVLVSEQTQEPQVTPMSDQISKLKKRQEIVKKKNYKKKVKVK